MKKLSVFVFCIFTLISCKKSPLSVPTSIEYKVDGSPVQIIGGRDTSGQLSVAYTNLGCYIYESIGAGYYTITCFEKTYGALIAIPTGHDSLQAKTYTGELGAKFLVNGNSYGIVNIHDSIILNITRYSYGSVDGTFSGAFSDTAQNTISITEGKLNNLKVYY